MELLIDSRGNIRCLYDEAISLAELGYLSIRRGSHVEPNEHGQWLCDLSPVSGPTLGPFANRSDALAAEVAWLNEHWLQEPVLQPTGYIPCQRLVSAAA
jgi:hypothetical protein